MPRIELTVQDRGGVTAPLAGGPVYLPNREIRVWGYFGTEPVMRAAVLDTGAPACTLPARVWTALDRRHDITWLGPRVSGHSIKVFGGSYPFRLGRVRLQLVDLASELAPRDVIAICTDDPQATASHLQLPLLVGLADVLHGRSLLVEASADGRTWTAALTEP